MNNIFIINSIIIFTNKKHFDEFLKITKGSVFIKFIKFQNYFSNVDYPLCDIVTIIFFPEYEYKHMLARMNQESVTYKNDKNYF